MKITIEKVGDQVKITEEVEGTEADIINAFAVALAFKASSMFTNQKYAEKLIEKAYANTVETLGRLYELQDSDNDKE